MHRNTQHTQWERERNTRAFICWFTLHMPQYGRPGTWSSFPVWVVGIQQLMPLAAFFHSNSRKLESGTGLNLSTLTGDPGILIALALSHLSFLFLGPSLCTHWSHPHPWLLSVTRTFDYFFGDFNSWGRLVLSPRSILYAHFQSSFPVGLLMTSLTNYYLKFFSFLRQFHFPFFLYSRTLIAEPGWLSTF